MTTCCWQDCAPSKRDTLLQCCIIAGPPSPTRASIKATLGQRHDRLISPISQIVIIKKYETIMKHSHIDNKVKIRFRSFSTSLNNVISFSLHMLDDIFIRNIEHVIYARLN